MSTNTHFTIDRHFTRADQNLPKIHPLRGTILRAQKRNPLPMQGGNPPEARRTGVVRDILISIMGGISALVPMVIAAQTLLGA